jgi:Flp pilus assembly pilin Flp
MLGKRVQFDDETWSTFDQLTEDRTQNFPELADNDSGNTSIEYGLIAAGIAIGITMAVSSLGSHVKSTISNLADMASSSSTAASSVAPIPPRR